jgi:hypothetical protein
VAEDREGFALVRRGVLDDRCHVADSAALVDEDLTMRMMRRAGAAIATLTCTAIAGCTRGHQSPHVVLTSLEQLRAAFNADSGKVRAIFLASPT